MAKAEGLRVRSHLAGIVERGKKVPSSGSEAAEEVDAEQEEDETECACPLAGCPVIPVNLDHVKFTNEAERDDAKDEEEEEEERGLKSSGDPFFSLRVSFLPSS
ncbi:hypothetical protein Trydic_g15740 [Trypoxylus dichotomus]